MQIQGKHVLITGSAKRLGRAIAEALLPKGIRLTAHFRDSEKEAKQLASAVVAAGGLAHTVGADLSSMSEIDALVTKSHRHFGPVEILINSASIFFPSPVATEPEWDSLMAINAKAQFFLSQQCAERLKKENRQGVIINLCDSTLARTAKGYTPYLASKAALLTITRNMARDYAPGIRVNAISPGPVLLPENYTAEQRERSLEKTLLKRLGSPKDIAACAEFLIGNDYITGQDIAVDGGRSLWNGWSG